MINLFLPTERILDVLSRNDNLKHNLYNTKLRNGCLKILTQIYLQASDKPFTYSDYKNLYDIYYIFLTQDTTLSMKVEESKKFIATVKSNPEVIITHFSTIVNK